MGFFESLLTSSPGQTTHPETLEMLGRKASMMYRQQNVPLNDAIRQLVAENPDLNNEHIKRIVEFANNVTFQELFQGSDDKNVHFPVADPGVVIRDLKDGGSPSHDGKTLDSGSLDYMGLPQQTSDVGMRDLEEAFGQSVSEKNAAFGVDDVVGGLVGHHYGKKQRERGERYDFGVPQAAGALFLPGGAGYQVGRYIAHHTEQKPKEKTASPYGINIGELGHSNPIDEVYDLHLRLQAAREKVAQAHETFDLSLQEARKNLYDVVKNEVIDPDGSGLGGVIGALEKVAAKDAILLVLRPMVEKLAGEEWLPREQLEKSLEKRAGKTVNTNHPLIATWAGLVKAAEEKAKAAAGIAELDESLSETEAFLKQAGRLTTSVKGVAGYAGRKAPVALKQRGVH